MLWGNDTKNSRRNSAFAIAIVVTSRSSSFEYTMSVHAVHAAAERDVCYIVVSTETPQTTTNPSQTLLPVYKLTPAALKVLTTKTPTAFSSAFCTDELQSRPPA